MKVTTNPAPLYAHATEAFYAAASDTLEVAKATAPVITGEYRDSMKMWRRKRSSGPTARIGSRLPQAGALERGAWSKGRGPHISRANAPGTLKAAGETFPDAYTARLKGTAIRGAAFVTGEFGRELGLPGLELGSGL